MRPRRTFPVRLCSWCFAVLGVLLLASLWSYAGTVTLDRGQVLVIAGDPAGVADCLGANPADGDEQARMAVLMSTRLGWYTLDREVHHAAYDLHFYGWPDGLMAQRVHLPTATTCELAVPPWVVVVPIVAGLGAGGRLGPGTAGSVAGGGGAVPGVRDGAGGRQRRLIRHCGRGGGERTPARAIASPGPVMCAVGIGRFSGP